MCLYIKTRFSANRSPKAPDPIRPDMHIALGEDVAEGSGAPSGVKLRVVLLRKSLKRFV